MAPAPTRHARGGFGHRGKLRCGASIVVLCAVAAAGCSLPGASYNYVKSSTSHTYLRLPKHWKLYSKQGVVDRLKAADPSSADAISTQYKYFIHFDASPVLASDSLTALTPSTLPHGQLWVRSLTVSDHESLSFSTLNSQLIKNFDTLVQGGQIKVLATNDLRKPTGYWGRRVVYQLTNQDGTAGVVVDQTAMVDSGATVLYLLYVTCSTACYQTHKNDFSTVVSSWNITQE